MRKICAITLLLCSSLVHAQGQYICAGQIATIVASNPSNLSNPSYSLNPGGIISSNGVFTVQPAVSTNYTVYVSGMMGSFFATTTNTVQINVSQAPTFSLVSPSNYTLGCSSKSFAVVNITNAQTTPTPGGILSGTALAQGQQLPPSGPLGNAFSFTLTSSGTYTAVVRDNSTGCDTHIPFSIIANTLLPVLDSVKVPRSLLDCATSSVELTIYGGSNTSFSWRAPGNISQAGQTFTVYSIPAQPTQTLVGTFTAVVTDNNNLCGTQSVVTIYQNLFKPNALITPASASLTCQTPSVILTNASSTGIPPNGPFTYSAPVVAAQWFGPAAGTQTMSSTYVAVVPGTYTLVALDLNNGCTAIATRIVQDGRVFALLTPPGLADFNLCGKTSVTITPVFQGSPGPLTFTWTAPVGASVSAVNSQNLVSSTPGVYTLVVQNQPGCQTVQTYTVVQCLGLVEQPGQTSVYPNPVHDILHLVLISPGTIHLFDATGKLVLGKNVQREAELDLSVFPTGVYLLQLPDKSYHKVVRE